MCGSCVPKVHALPHHALPHHLLEGRHRAVNVLLIVRDRIGKHWGRGEETVAIVRSQNPNEGPIVRLKYLRNYLIQNNGYDLIHEIFQGNLIEFRGEGVLSGLLLALRQLARWQIQRVFLKYIFM